MQQEGTVRMRFFTAEQYEKMQVSGALVFPESEEDFLANKQWYIDEGRDFEVMTLDSYKLMEPFLLRYLPDDLREAAERGELTGLAYPSAALRARAAQWRAEWEREWKASAEQYWAGYREYVSELPPHAKVLTRMHDAVIKEVSVAEDSGALELLCAGSMMGPAEVRFVFDDVIARSLPADLKGGWWLYEELYRRGEHFELRALLNSPRSWLATSELRLTARGVRIKSFRSRRASFGPPIIFATKP